MTDYHLVRARKGTSEVLDYTIDWSNEMASDEIIITSSWATSDSATIDSDGNATQTATVWLSGGTLNDICTVTNTAITDQGRTFVGSIDVYIK